MATSSITKNFVISGKEQVEMFIAALEASEKDLAKEKKEKKKKLNIIWLKMKRNWLK